MVNFYALTYIRIAKRFWHYKDYNIFSLVGHGVHSAVFGFTFGSYVCSIVPVIKVFFNLESFFILGFPLSLDTKKKKVSRFLPGPVCLEATYCLFHLRWFLRR